MINLLNKALDGDSRTKFYWNLLCSLIENADDCEWNKLG